MFKFFFVLVSLLAVPAPPSGNFVHDFAGILPQGVVSELESVIQEVNKQTTAEIEVVTVSSLDGRTIEEYANTLFNNWGIGKRSTNNGVLFLIAPIERRTRIEIGYGLEPLFTDSVAGDILAELVLPQFKAGTLVEGVRSGTIEIARILRENPTAAAGIPNSAPLWVRTPRRNALMFIVLGGVVGFVFFLMGAFATQKRSYYPALYALGSAAVILITAYGIYLGLKLKNTQPLLGMISSGGIGLISLIYNTRRFFRFGPHLCPHCGGPSMLMDEAKDDTTLSDIQRLEESIGSVDYDVWFCPACLKSDVEKYVSFFSNFKDCPMCKNRTYSETITTITAATSYRTGKRRVDGKCVSCSHTSTRTEIIPRVSSSSGSSSGGGSGGGGGGGGSSGGGGASGGW